MREGTEKIERRERKEKEKERKKGGKEVQLLLISSVATPRARPDPVGGSEPKSQGRSFKAINQIPFVIVLLNFSFQKCRDPNP